jgi:hypothetical protein
MKDSLTIHYFIRFLRPPLRSLNDNNISSTPNYFPPQLDLTMLFSRSC